MSGGGGGQVLPPPPPAMPTPRMPLPGERSAPRWRGKEGKLAEFLRSFEVAAKQAKLSDGEMRKQLGLYISKAHTQKLLESLPGFLVSWEKYKEDILKYFPKADPDRFVTMAMLEKLVDRTHKKRPFRKASEFAKYNREFMRRANGLEDKGILTAAEKARKYWKGLPTKTRNKVEQRLETKLPDKSITEYTFEEWWGAVNHIMEKDRKREANSSDEESSEESDSSSSSDESNSEGSSDSEDERSSKKRHKQKKKLLTKKEPKESKVKKEPTSDLHELLLKMNTTQDKALSAVASVTEKVQTLSKTVSNIQQRGSPRPAYGQTPSGNRSGRPPQTFNTDRNRGCHFCGRVDGHIMRSCLRLQGYIERGLIRHDPDTRRWLMVSSGEPVPSEPANIPMVERVNNKLREQKERTSAAYQATQELSAAPKDQVQSYLIETRLDEYFRGDVATGHSEARNGESELKTWFSTDEDLQELVSGLDEQRKQGVRTRSMGQYVKPEGPTQSQKTILKKSSGNSQATEPKVGIPAVADDSQHLTFPDRSPPLRYAYKSPAEDPELVEEVLKMLNEGRLGEITPAHLLAVAPVIRAKMINYLRGQRVEVNHLMDKSTNQHKINKVVGVKSLPLREIEVTLPNGVQERAVLDDGSSIIIMRKDLWQQIGSYPLMRDESVAMESADGSVNQTLGLIRDLPITLGHITFYVQVQVVGHSPFRFLLGRTFSALAGCAKHDDADGHTMITITDPNKPTITETLPTFARIPSSEPPQEAYYSELTLEQQGAPIGLSKIGLLMEEDIVRYFPTKCKESYAYKRKYKPVEKKIRAVPATLPEEFRIVRRIPRDPLETLPEVASIPAASFQQGERLTAERWAVMKDQLAKEGFLLAEEIRLLRDILKNNERTLAWEENMRGSFNPEYFPPVIMPVIDHEPWAKKAYPIPAGLREQVIEEVKKKIAMGVYEGSSSSYRSPIFVVPKKDPTKIRIVHDLQDLNKVTIRDSGVPPVIDEVIEETAGRVIYSLIDALVGYDHQLIDERSRDLTTFQTPLGSFRLTVLPMGWSNSVSIFHGHITFILQEEIPQKSRPFIDDIVIQGGRTKYLDSNGQPRRLDENHGVRQFVFEHLVDLNRILHKLGCAGVTISAKKISLCVPQISILGHTCNENGRIPDNSHVQKVVEWPPCRNLTEVRGFLGVCNLCRIFIRDYAKIANPLTQLTRKDIPFEWGTDQQAAFHALKHAVTHAPVLRPLDYQSGLPVILAVDSSLLAAGWIIWQEDINGKRHPVRYGSRVWKPHESRYGQAKLELFGLLVALKATRAYTIGLKHLVVELDAEYVKGMINNPETIPNATLNRWIAIIRLFDIELRHVPADKHKGPDGLSRKAPDPSESTDDDLDDWIEQQLEHFFVDYKVPTPIYAVGNRLEEVTTIPTSPKRELSYESLRLVEFFLKNLKFPSETPEETLEKATRELPRFFIHEDRLYKKDADGRHKRVVLREDRLRIMKAAHDGLGHKGFGPVFAAVRTRFWWPEFGADIKWYIQSCLVCQQRKLLSYKLPLSGRR